MQIHAGISDANQAALCIAEARQRGDVGLALELATTADAAFPNAAAILLEYAAALGAAGRHDDMSATYRRAVEADPAQWSAVLGRVRALRQAGDPAGAETMLRALADIRPADGALLAEFASLLWRARQVGAAEDAYRGVLALDPSHAGALAGLGHVARHRNDHAAALAWFEQALAQRPGDRGLREQRARSLMQLNRFDEAAAAYEALLAEAADDPKALTNPARARILADVAAMHWRAVRVAQAEAAFRGVLAIDPTHPGALSGLGRVLRHHNDHAGALVQFELALARHPRDRVLRQDIARSLIELNRLDEAAQLLAGLRDEAPGDVQVAMELGRVHRLQGDADGALRELRAAAAIDVTPGLVMAIGTTLCDLRRGDEAEPYFLQAVQLEAGFLPALLQLAGLARSRGEDEAALKWFSRAAQADPSDPSLLFEVAMTLSDLQRDAACDAVMAQVAAMPQSESHEPLRLRRLQYCCRSLRLDDGLACLREFYTGATMPTRVVPWAAALYAARGDWDEVLALFTTRVVPGRGADLVSATEPLLEAVGRAARAQGRQAEVIGLMADWPSATTPAAIDLHDQLAEEMRLLHTLQPASSPPDIEPITPWRAERSARLAGVLSVSVPVVEGTIFLCTDLHYLLGALVALSSMLRHNRAALRHCRFCVFAAEDALPMATSLLDRLATAYAIPIEIISAATLGRACTGFRADWGSFTPGHRLSDAAYYRILAALWLAEQGRPGTTLYFDSDTYIGRGVADLLRFDLRGQPLGARREVITASILRAARKLDMPAEAYFNSGVLLFDLAHPDAVPALRHAFEFSVHSPERLSFLDQCALNRAFEGKTTELPEKFNVYVRHLPDQAPVPARATVRHYLSRPKPWDPAYCLPEGASWMEEFYALADILKAPELRALMTTQFGITESTVMGLRG